MADATQSSLDDDAAFLRRIAADYEYANPPMPIYDRLMRIAASLPSETRTAQENPWIPGGKHHAIHEALQKKGANSDDKSLSLLSDLKKRAEAVDAACKRSNQMERDFLEKKVLNREANEALEDFGRKRGQFGEYLLQRSDEIIAALESNPSAEQQADDDAPRPCIRHLRNSLCAPSHEPRITQKELEQAINRLGLDNDLNTPDFRVAEIIFGNVEKWRDSSESRE